MCQPGSAAESRSGVNGPEKVCFVFWSFGDENSSFLFAFKCNTELKTAQQNTKEVKNLFTPETN